MSYSALPSSTPSVQGVEAEGVQALLDVLETTPGVEPHSLMIVRHGHVVVAGWWYPYSKERPQLLYSVSKSFTSTAAGFAVAGGLLDLDRTVLSYFPELDGEVTDPRSRSMLVRHLASMSSGHLEDTWDYVVATGDPEPVRAFLQLPPAREPGTVFTYNQSCTYTLAAIVQRLTGDTLGGYLRKELPGPFGGSELRWQRDSLGRELGFSGLHVTTETLARLGLLYLERGAWEGEQRLDAAWVAEATRAQVSTADGTTGPGPDWQQGYGYQFWRSRYGYRADGYAGQFSLVLPEQEAVVAITSQSDDTQALLDAVWDNLLPALLDGPVTETGSDERLRERLDKLAVPVKAAEPIPPAGGQQVWVGTTFLPLGGSCEQQPTLSAVTVNTDEGGWRVTVSEGPLSFSVPMGTGAWAVSEGQVVDAAAVALSEPGGASPAIPPGRTAGAPPGGSSHPHALARAGDGGGLPVACMGGWVDEATLRFDMIFLETPHRLTVTCKIPEEAFDAEWATAPIFGHRLADLHAPAYAEATGQVSAEAG